jgi:hypothetical protein
LITAPQLTVENLGLLPAEIIPARHTQVSNYCLRKLVHRAIYKYDPNKISTGILRWREMLVHRWSVSFFSTKSLKTLGLPSPELLESQHFEAITV